MPQGGKVKWVSWTSILALDAKWLFPAVRNKELKEQNSNCPSRSWLVDAKDKTKNIWCEGPGFNGLRKIDV